MDQVCTESVSDFRFVGVDIEADLTWSVSDNEEGTAETSLLETSQEKPPRSQNHFHPSIIAPLESVLSSCRRVWFDRKVLHRVASNTHNIIGCLKKKKKNLKAS